MTVSKKQKDLQARRRIRFDSGKKRNLEILVKKTNVHIYAYVRNTSGEQGNTVFSVSTLQLQKSKALSAKNTSNISAAEEVGKLLAKAFAEKGLKREDTYINRGANKYHGRIKALVENFYA